MNASESSPTSSSGDLGVLIRQPIARGRRCDIVGLQALVEQVLISRWCDAAVRRRPCRRPSNSSSVHRGACAAHHVASRRLGASADRGAWVSSMRRILLGVSGTANGATTASASRTCGTAPSCGARRSVEFERTDGAATRRRLAHRWRSAWFLEHAAAYQTLRNDRLQATRRSVARGHVEHLADAGSRCRTGRGSRSRCRRAGRRLLGDLDAALAQRRRRSRARRRW